MQNKIRVKIKRVDKRAKLPEYTHEGDACMDMRAILNAPVAVYPGETFIVDTGLAFEIPEGYVMQLFPRSGLGIKKGLVLGNSTGIIDSKFRDTVKVALFNRSKHLNTVENGDRIAQFNIVPFPKVEFIETSELEETDRGEGLGSSGVK